MSSLAHPLGSHHSASEGAGEGIISRFSQDEDFRKEVA